MIICLERAHWMFLLQMNGRAKKVSTSSAQEPKALSCYQRRGQFYFVNKFSPMVFNFWLIFIFFELRWACVICDAESVTISFLHNARICKVTLDEGAGHYLLGKKSISVWLAAQKEMLRVRGRDLSLCKIVRGSMTALAKIWFPLHMSSFH